MPYHASYHETQDTSPWHPAPQAFDNVDPPGRPMHNQRLGTPIVSRHPYNNQQAYAAQPRTFQHEGTNSSHNYLPRHNPSQGPPYNPEPGHLARHEFYSTQQFSGSGHDGAQARSHSRMTPQEDAERHVQHGLGPPMGHGSCGVERSVSAGGDSWRYRSSNLPDREVEVHSTTPHSRLGRQPPMPTPRVHASPGLVNSHDQHDSHPLEQMAPPVTSHSPPLLSTDSSKSFPPYTYSQRKLLRAEEKLYLKEVKSAIAEGRVPRVFVQQNNSGHIVQYKTQFLNALKLAALAIVQDADIDIQNPLTMQEIMKEVRRQFIIEKPLPEGFVGGFLQRLFKRNRAVYHRHWTQHGDDSKPDDCSQAAWSQLVDYWKSMEGNKECERNRTNASAKKKAPVSFPAHTIQVNSLQLNA